MQIVKCAASPLPPQAILTWLRELRANPHVPLSGFSVTAIMRAQYQGDHYYFAGVNMENPDHRLSIHGEEGSIAAMVSVLGPEARIVEGWVMGAPRNLIPGDDHPLAHQGVACCGKCRQQIASFAEPEAIIHGVSLNGTFQSTTVAAFLPDAFRRFAATAASDLSGIAAVPHSRVISDGAELTKRVVRAGSHLSHEDIFFWLDEMQSLDFITRLPQAVVVHLKNGAYVAGVKVEDVAFLSIDPLQSALAIATTAFGRQDVLGIWSLCKEAASTPPIPHSYNPHSLSSLQTLVPFAAHHEIPIHVFSPQAERRAISLRHYTQTYLAEVSL